MATAYALKGFSDTGLVFWRTALGVPFFLPILARRVKGLDLSPEDWLRVAAVGILGYAAPLLVGTAGQRLSTATNASLLIGVEPVAIVLLSAVFLGEMMTVLKTTAIALGLAGSSLIVLQAWPWDAQLTPRLKGDALLFLHGVLWALFSVIGKPVLRKVDSLTFTALAIVFALAALALSALAGLDVGHLRVSGQALLAVSFLAIGVTFLGTLAWSKGLEMVPASKLACFVFLQPLVGVLLGSLWQGEAFTAWSASGGVLILLGALAASRDEA